MQHATLPHLTGRHVLCRCLRRAGATLAILALASSRLCAADPPTFAWGDYLGAAGADFANDVTLTPGGDVVVVGQTAGNGWISGGHDSTYNGGVDAFVMKLTPMGEQLWSTYLGASGEDWANAVAVNANGEIFVAGYTTSGGWIAGGADTHYSHAGDGFLVKLSPEGAVLWSTYVGGEGIDDAYAVAVDGNGYICTAGATTSADWLSGGGDTSPNGGTDGFVAKYSTAGVRQWGTYVGGSGDDAIYDVVADASGSIYATGTTASTLWTVGGFDTAYGGGVDGFLIKLNGNGNHAWSAYLGGSNEDWGIGLTLNGTGDTVFVTGYTDSIGWIDSDGDGDPGTSWDVDYAGGGDAFLVKVTSAADLQWSTYIGGADHEHGRSVSLGPDGAAYVTGATNSAGWVTGGYDTSYGGSRDGFVVKYGPGGSERWACYLGGSGSDTGNGIAVDAAGNVMVAGDTESTGWITGGFDTSISGADGFVARLGDGAPAAPSGAFLASMDNSDVLVGRGIWDLSGPYVLDVNGGTLTMQLTHDSKGKLSGPSALFTLPASPGKEAYAFPMTVSGSVKAAKGKVTAKVSLKGSQVGIPGDPAAKARAAISMSLTLDPLTRRLSGPWKASWTLGKIKTAAAGNGTFELALAMDGTYDLLFNLVGEGTGISGAAVMTLSNGAEYTFVAKGTYGGGISTVTLTGDPDDPPAKGLKFALTMKTFDGGLASLRTFSGKAFGQTLKW